MRVGGPTRAFADAASTDELLDLVRAADSCGEPLLVMGGGSNLVVGDAGWDGLTVRIRSSAVEIDGDLLRVDAGMEWDDLVALTVDEGLAGLEALSGIPGTAGATPVQNVGAFGALTSDVLRSITVYDRSTGEVAEWDNARCRFGPHRQSLFKHTDRYVILRVTFALRRCRLSGPLRFDRLVARLGVEPGASADIADVRAAVRELRREKGSIVDPADPDTWGVGSFFLNPVLPHVPAQAAGAPHYPDEQGTKLPAAWLIQNAGFPPGWGQDFGRGRVRLSTKHALAVSNRGGATTREVMQFAAHLRDAVEQRFGVRLVPECHLVNCSLDDEPAAA